MTKALFAGSFDPFTNGHLDTVQRVAPLFDTVYIAVATNTSKQTLFSSKERKALIEEATRHMDNVETIDFSGGLTIDLAKELNCSVLIRGVRSVKDYQYEADIANMNRTLAPEIETLLTLSKPEYSFISSSMIKEVVQFGGDVSAYLPPNVAEAMLRKYKRVTEL